MTLPMSQDVRRAIAQSGQEPVKIIDPETNAVYLLVPAEEYERALNTDGAAAREAYPAQEAVAHAQGWDDPRMDDYDDYDAHQSEAN